MTEMELYKLWCEKAVDDPDLQTELKSIEGDEAAIQDRFYRDHCTELPPDRFSRRP